MKDFPEPFICLFCENGMRLTAHIFFLLVVLTSVKSQQIQPTYLGDASWHKVPNQQERELLSVTPTKSPIKKIITKKNPLTIFQKKIDPGTIILHNGPTIPVIQKIRITAKKLQKPKVSQAPPLQTRDNISYNVTYTDKKHGFVGNNAMDFAEDEEHDIWIGSEKGLIRYDGYYYYLYDLKLDFVDMPDCSLAYDQQKRLWCASDNGVFFIKNDSLFSIQSSEINLSTIACKKVMIDPFQRVWIATKNNGAICIDGNTMKIYDKRCGLPGNYFESVFLDKKGNLFMACRDFGIVLIEPDKMRMFFSNTQNMKYHIFLSFYENEEGIWAGSFLSGMMRLGLKDTIQYSINGKFNEAIYDIKKAPGGIWISCYSHALCYFSKKKLLLFNESNGLLNNLPLKIFEDSFQNLWVSNVAGFSRINENSFYLDNFQNPAIGFVRNIMPDNKKGGNWITTYGRNLIFQKSNEAIIYTFKLPSGITPYLYVNAGVLNNDGTVWMGTLGEGIVHASENEFTGYKYSNFTDHGIVVNVKADAENKVWFCPTRYGLIVYDNNKLWRYTNKSGLLSNDVANIFLDAKKKIYWTFAEGLQRFNGPAMETFYLGSNLFQDKVNGMLELDPETLLWATNQSGLLAIKNGQVYQFTTTNGLTANSIKSIIRDSTGKIWISTDKGIESFRLNKLSIIDHTIFNESNGSYILDAENVLLDSTGLPYWGMGARKLVFNPDFAHPKKAIPLFSFKHVSLDNKILSPKDQISIFPDQKIQIDYKTIYWGRENNLKLNYLLISNRDDTTERAVQNNGSIIISDVLPGTYRVLLKARDNNEVSFSNPISITVNNFWYNTWAFRIIMGVLVISGIIFYFKQKAKRQLMVNELLKNKVREQTEIIEKEKDALMISYQTIDSQNKEKDVLIEEINHRVKNNLQFITAILEMQMNKQFSREVIQALLGTSRRIKAMSLIHELLYNKKDQKGLSMKAYIHELIDNLKEMANDDNNPVNIQMEVDELVMDSKTALSLGMIISELVSNSFKHAFNKVPKPKVWIQLKKDAAAGLFRLTIRDNGKGYQQFSEISQGLGTRLIDIFSRQLDGEYTIQSNRHFTYELQFKTIET